MTTPKLSLLQLEGVSIFEQLQIEEALLRADNRNWCLINTNSPAAIVMGISGKAELLINNDKLGAAPIPVIRRFSGGGTVVVDPSTYFVTWIFNSADIGIEGCPQKIHRWSADLYKRVFPTIGMDLRENDYVIGERKCGGNAQYICRGRWLHHTSFLWDYSPEMMEYLLMPPKTPYYRIGRTHNEFLCRLNEVMVDKAEIGNCLLRYLRGNFDVNEVIVDELQALRQGTFRRTTCVEGECCLAHEIGHGQIGLIGQPLD